MDKVLNIRLRNYNILFHGCIIPMDKNKLISIVRLSQTVGFYPFLKISRSVNNSAPDQICKTIQQPRTAYSTRRGIANCFTNDVIVLLNTNLLYSALCRTHTAGNAAPFERRARRRGTANHPVLIPQYDLTIRANINKKR